VVSGDHKAIETVIGADLGYNSDLSGFIANLKATAIKGDSGLNVYIGGPIAVDLIAMITLLPALLVVFGRWIFWPVRPGYNSAEPTTRGLWSRAGQAISHRPRAVWLVTAILLGAGVFGLAGFKFGPLTTAQSFRGTPPSIIA
jgi:putative drug exporter of the RND superfamily